MWIRLHTWPTYSSRETILQSELPATDSRIPFVLNQITFKYLLFSPRFRLSATFARDKFYFQRRFRLSCEHSIILFTYAPVHADKLNLCLILKLLPFHILHTKCKVNFLVNLYVWHTQTKIFLGMPHKQQQQQGPIKTTFLTTNKVAWVGQGARK